MKTFDRQKWTQIRARGHVRFTARRGLLYWGVPHGLLVTLGLFIYELVTHAPTPSVWSMIGSFTLFTLVFGYGMGETEWRRGERAYHEDHTA
jgi:hypothetical protein